MGKTRVRSSTSFLRSNLRGRIKTVRVAKGSKNVGKEEVLKHFEPNQRADKGTKAQSQSAVKPLPCPPAVIAINKKPGRTKLLQRIPSLLIDLTRQANPFQ